MNALPCLPRYIYPHTFFKKRWGYCNRLRPSTCLSVTPSSLKPLDEIKPNLVCVCCSHEWGVQRHIFWGPGEGPKDQILSNIIKFQLQSQFQRFLNQTLCVCSQMKNIKHIRRDFHSAAWIMPQGWDLGVPWGVGGVKKKNQKFNQS